LDGGIGLERLLPTTVLGIILSTVRWRTGSVWPSMALHVCHNTILFIVGTQAPGSTEEIPTEWLLGGAAGIVGAAALLGFCGDSPCVTRAGTS
jgi:membrane protease YdiL (CAAX protease family)